MTPSERPGSPRFYELLREIEELHEHKNHDYASGMAEGAMGNFIRIAGLMKNYPDMRWDTPLGVSIIYMLKQLDAAMSLASTGKESQTGEGVAERLRDVATYALLAIVLKEET